MAIERGGTGTSIVDVLDRVLDKGVIIDAWVRVSLVGIDLLTVEARIVVASIETYLKSSEALAQAGFNRPVETMTIPVTVGRDGALTVGRSRAPSRSRSNGVAPLRPAPGSRLHAPWTYRSDGDSP